MHAGISVFVDSKEQKFYRNFVQYKIFIIRNWKILDWLNLKKARVRQNIPSAYMFMFLRTASQLTKRSLLHIFFWIFVNIYNKKTVVTKKLKQS